EIYDRLDSGHPRVVVRDTFRQCGYGVISLVLFEYSLRLDLSRFFLIFFTTYAFVLLLSFRLTAGRLIGIIRREFSAPHYVMVVGMGERARRVAAELEMSAEYGIRLRGFLEDQPDIAEVALQEPYPVHPIALLPALLRRHVIDEIIFAVESESLAQLEE